MTKHFTLQSDIRNFTEGYCYSISQPRKKIMICTLSTSKTPHKRQLRYVSIKCLSKFSGEEEDL